MDNTKQTETVEGMHSPHILEKKRTIINTQEIHSSMEEGNNSLFSYSLTSDSFFIRNTKNQTEVTENYFIVFINYFLSSFASRNGYIFCHPPSPGPTNGGIILNE